MEVEMPVLQNSRERTIWTADRLRAVIEGSWRGQSVVVVSNREPLRHDRADDGGVVAGRSASGLVTALEPVIAACGGVWVAHGAGTADRTVVDARSGFNVRACGSGYRLRRVWLDAHEEQGYYCGFSNEGLWPLCHRAHVQPIFRSTDFAAYSAVNRRFADAVCDEAHTDAPLILVQDYHLALVPRLARRRLPQSSIVTFWHIPCQAPGVSRSVRRAGSWWKASSAAASSGFRRSLNATTSWTRLKQPSRRMSTSVRCR
jgi:trehalose-6-phosphate synthase